VASKTRSGNQDVGGSFYSVAAKSKTLKPVLAKKKKQKVEPTQPIIKINYDATREQPNQYMP
jgi:hypothetical protein